MKQERKDSYAEGYNDALDDVHAALMATYQSNFDWEDINGVLENLRISENEEG